MKILWNELSAFSACGFAQHIIHQKTWHIWVLNLVGMCVRPKLVFVLHLWGEKNKQDLEGKIRNEKKRASHWTNFIITRRFPSDASVAIMCAPKKRKRTYDEYTRKVIRDAWQTWVFDHPTLLLDSTAHFFYHQCVRFCFFLCRFQVDEEYNTDCTQILWDDV